MHDLKDVTFIIPFQADSEDRIRNVALSINYITKNFDTNIIVKELYKYEPEFSENLKEKVLYLSEKNEAGFFHKTRILNDMLVQTKTPYVYQYDCDVLLPVNSYLQAREMLANEFDVVCPFTHGSAYKPVYLDEEAENIFLDSDYSLEIIEQCSDAPKYTDYGYCKFYKKDSYVAGYMENEQFRSYGPEDKEIYYRFDALGFKIGRVEDWVYHIEHLRDVDSDITNPYHNDNVKLYNSILKMDKDEIAKYYSNQEYYKKRLQEIADA
jgi:hypothetical protein